MGVQTVTERIAAGARAAPRRSLRSLVGQIVEWPYLRYRRVSLYTRVVALNAAILFAATAALALTPATVSFPLAVEQAIALGVGVVVMVVANALLLRISFGGLAGLVRRMETLDLLKPRERLPVVGGAETRAVVLAFNQMLDRLEEERRQASRRTLTALEGERRRIGQELHDEIGQQLTGILLQLGRVVPDSRPGVRPRLLAIQQRTRETLDQVGTLAWQLRPGILDDLGLGRALEALAQTVEEHAGIVVVCRLPTPMPPLSPEVELALYRVAQEGLTNAVRHSGGRRVELELRIDERRLSLLVADDGEGLSREETESAGIRGMRERALLVGGKLTIDSRHGGGVRILLTVPRSRLEAV